MVNTKVSFIIPVYNVEKYVEECVESVLHQNGHDIEIILVDDGSTDDSGKICDRLAQEKACIKVLHQKNQGVSIARNNGIKESRGEWLFFVDGDDTIAENVLDVALPYLNDDNDVCFVNHIEIKDGETSKVQNPGEIVKFDENDYEEFQLAVFNKDYRGKYDYYKVRLSCATNFYRSQFIIDYHILFPPAISTGEDAVFNFQVFEIAKKGVFLECAYYYYRIWTGSVTQRYDMHVEDKFRDLHTKYKELINTSRHPERYKNAYNERCIWSIGFCCLLKYCNKKNPNSYKKKKEEFKKFRNEYIEEIQNVDLNTFRFQKKVMFWGIQKGWFGFVLLLCRLKNRN